MRCASQRLSWEATTSPSAFAPKTRPNREGGIPKSSMRTKGEPAMYANMAAWIAPPTSDMRTKAACPKAARKARAVSPGAWRRRASRGRLSGRAAATRPASPAATPARTRKMARQPPNASTCPPASGARMGAAPMTSRSDEYMRADSRRSK